MRTIAGTSLVDFICKTGKQKQWIYCLWSQKTQLRHHSACIQFGKHGEGLRRCGCPPGRSSNWWCRPSKIPDPAKCRRSTRVRILEGKRAVRSMWSRCDASKSRRHEVRSGWSDERGRCPLFHGRMSNLDTCTWTARSSISTRQVILAGPAALSQKDRRSTFPE